MIECQPEIGKPIFKSDSEVNLDVLEEFIHVRFVIKEYDPQHNWAKKRTLYKFRKCQESDFNGLHRDDDWENFLTALCPREEDFVNIPTLLSLSFKERYDFGVEIFKCKTTTLYPHKC